MKIKLLFLFVLVLACPSSKCFSWDDINPIRWIGDLIRPGVDAATQGMRGDMKQDFRELINYMFDQKVQPLIPQIELTAQKIIAQAAVAFDESSKKLVNESKKALEDVIDKLIADFTSLINETAKKFNQLIDKLMTETKALVNETAEKTKEVIDEGVKKIKT